MSPLGLLVALLEFFRPQRPVTLTAPPDVSVWLSVTSTPKRLKTLPQYLSQFRGASGILVCLPELFRNTEAYSPDTVEAVQRMPGVTLLRAPQDIGPLCKLVPALQWLGGAAEGAAADAPAECSRTLIVTIDDDVWYTANAIQSLIDVALANGLAAVVANKTTRAEGLPIMAQGHWGVAYPVGLLTPAWLKCVMAYTAQPACARHDDMCISWALQETKTRVVATGLGRGAAWESALGYDDDALSLSGAASDTRCSEQLRAKSYA